MALKERLQESLADVEADIKRIEEQMNKPAFCTIHEAEYAAVFANRDNILRSMLQDSQIRKLDLERMIKELED